MSEPAAEPFGARLGAAFRELGHLCVGIDPHASLLGEWGLGDDADGLREFGLRVVDAAAGVAPVVKPQVAFFERHGSAGYAALEAVISAARDRGLLVLADPKRGDIGSTSDAYGEAWLTPGLPLEVDAITLSPYLGIDSAGGTWDRAVANGKGIFVLAATSNPEAIDVQTSRTASGSTVAASIVDSVREWNADAGGRAPRALGSAGLVIGATVQLTDYGITAESIHDSPVLVPGLGFQGGTAAALRSTFGAASANLLVSASRSILAAGPRGIDRAVRDHADDLAGTLA